MTRGTLFSDDQVLLLGRLGGQARKRRPPSLGLSVLWPVQWTLRVFYVTAHQEDRLQGAQSPRFLLAPSGSHHTRPRLGGVGVGKGTRGL